MLNKALITSSFITVLQLTNVAFSNELIQIQNAWARATPPHAKNGAIYLTIHNANTQNDALIEAEANASALKTELHTHINDNGVMRMRQVKEISIPSKSQVELKPHHDHIMLIELKSELKAGHFFDLKLKFQRAGWKNVKVEVKSIDADPSHHHH